MTAQCTNHRHARSQTRSQGSRPRCRASLLLCVVLALVAGGLPPGTARAQPPGRPTSSWETVNKIYTNVPNLYVPVRGDAETRLGLREVQLYVKTGPEQPWTLKGSAAPAQTAFNYQAPQDGDYGFRIVRIDKAGNPMPADVNREAPELVIVLDTQAPLLDVRLLPGTAAEFFVQCDARDANLNRESVKVEYHASNNVWQDMTAVPNQPGVFVAARTNMLTSRVRASAVDLAGNVTSRVVDVTAPPAPRLEYPVADTGPRTIAAGAVSSAAPLPATPPMTPPARPAVSNSFAPRATNVAAAAPAQPAPNTQSRLLVNSPHIELKYQIDQQGPSGVGKLEVWVTADVGQSWKRLVEDVNKQNPIEVDLPGDGLFGLKLVVSNGRGFGGTPPGRGDVPDNWIEVDTVEPRAELGSLRLGSGDEIGHLILTWNVSDKNLGPSPIDLYYSTQREGPWLSIGRRLKNDGIYRWPVPRDLGTQVFIRLVVSDLAGNTSRCDSLEPVTLDDLSRPQARVVDIVTRTLRPTAPAGN